MRILTILLLAPLLAMGQKYTEIKDLNIEYPQANWSYGIIDSTQIVQNVNNGTDYMAFSIPSIIVNNKLMTSFQLRNDYDFIGFYLQSLDLGTQQINFEYTRDRSNSIRKSAVVEMSIVDNQLYLHSFREKDPSDYEELEFAAGFVAIEPTISSFDLNTGELLDYYTIDQDQLPYKAAAISMGVDDYFSPYNSYKSMITYAASNNDSIIFTIFNHETLDFDLFNFKLFEPYAFNLIESRVNRPFMSNNAYYGMGLRSNPENFDETKQAFLYRFGKANHSFDRFDISDVVVNPGIFEIQDVKDDYILASIIYREGLSSSREIQMIQYSIEDGDSNSTVFGIDEKEYIQVESKLLDDKTSIIVLKTVDSDELHIYRGKINAEPEFLGIVKMLIDVNEIVQLNEIQIYNNELIIGLDYGTKGDFGAQCGSWKKFFSFNLENFGINTDISEIDIVNVCLYPNPTSDRLDILHPNLNSFTTYQIINELGQVITESAIVSNQLNISIEGITSGLYYIRLRHKKEERVIPFIKI